MPSPSPTDEPSSARLPRKFGPYLLFEQIGKGGMAEIFLARAQTDLGGRRLCVVKEILPSLVAHTRFAEMLIREAKLAAILDHTNIVKVIDLGRADGELFIAMEYVEGFDLNDLLRRCTTQGIPLPVEFGLAIVCAVLRGLDYAHRRTNEEGAPLGIVHRDVSPSNVLVSYEGEIKLCDFGIAVASQLVVEEEPDSGPGEALQGKAGYMSPEHARGEAIDARADVFSTGILLWELLSGRRLYRKDAGTSLLEQAREAAIPPITSRGLPHEARLHAVARRALEKDRAARYPSAGAMLRELEAYMSDANLIASPLRFGGWLESSFGIENVKRRRARQRAAEALAKGPLVELTPLPDLPPTEEPAPSSIAATTLDTDPPRPPLAPTPAAPPAAPARLFIGLLVAAALAFALAYSFLFRP